LRQCIPPFLGILPPHAILPRTKFTLPPNLAFCYIGSVIARHSSSGRQPNCSVQQRAPPIFDRAAITLGIGPHSSCYEAASQYYVHRCSLLLQTVAWSVCLSICRSVTLVSPGKRLLHRSRCRLGCGLGCAEGSMCYMGAHWRDLANTTEPSVCRSVTLVSPAKTAEPIEMPFGLRTRERPKNHVLDGVHIH